MLEAWRYNSTFKIINDPYFLLQWWNSTLRQHLKHSWIRLSFRKRLRGRRNGSLRKRKMLGLQEAKQRTLLREIIEIEKVQIRVWCTEEIYIWTSNGNNLQYRAGNLSLATSDTCFFGRRFMTSHGTPQFFLLKRIGGTMILLRTPHFLGLPSTYLDPMAVFIRV